MAQLQIKSTTGTRSLTLAHRDSNYFDAALSGDGVSAQKKIWGFEDAGALTDLFELLAQHWKGWEGTREGASREGDLFITASSDHLGHIRLDVLLTSQTPRDEWRVEAPIFLDAGSLQAVAEKISAFFAQHQN